MAYKAAVITVSDKGSRGERVDTSGPAVCAILREKGYSVEYSSVIPDDIDTIKAELFKNRQVIVETIVPGNADGVHDHVLHWILVYGYADGEFLIVDTDYEKKTTLTKGELEAFMDTPIGKIIISVGDLK